MLHVEGALHPALQDRNLVVEVFCGERNDLAGWDEASPNRLMSALVSGRSHANAFLPTFQEIFPYRSPSVTPGSPIAYVRTSSSVATNQDYFAQNRAVLFLRNPSAAALERAFERESTAIPTYTALGATASDMPSGFAHDELSVQLGTGRELFERCGQHLDAWNLQRSMDSRYTPKTASSTRPRRFC